MKCDYLLCPPTITTAKWEAMFIANAPIIASPPNKAAVVRDNPMIKITIRIV
jgi:hypothetical protein